MKGLFLGTGYAFLFFALIIMMNALTSRVYGQLQPEVKLYDVFEQRYFFHFFWACVSVAIGQTIQIVSWTHNLNRRSRTSRSLAGTSLSAVGATLLFMGTFFFGMYQLSMGTGYIGSDFNFYKEYGKLFLLIPVWLFFIPWNYFRRLFKTGKWFWILMVYSILLVVIFYKWASNHFWAVYL